MKEKVVLGMSGGVDSSVTAFLLKQSGYEVIGVTFQFWKADGFDHSAAGSDAKKVCDKLGIEHRDADFTDVFAENVIYHFINEYKNGRTPNPCVVCNRYVKFHALTSVADKWNVRRIATGHYAKIAQLDNGRFSLIRSESAKKDQTYALYNLSQEQLSRALMPLESMDKLTVRSIAKQNGLFLYDKPDSQEICFIPNNDYPAFLRHNGVAALPGDFVDELGNVLGQHQGIINYTAGQRKGLGVSFGKPMFVKKIDATSNRVFLSSNEELFSSGLSASHVNFMGIGRLEGRMRVYGKIRYAHAGAECEIDMEGDRLHCQFLEPQRAITPGQSVVFYKDNALLLGGVIDGSF